MVIKREILFKDNYFEGFNLSENFDYESLIIEHHEYKRRGDVEENPTLKQPIPYALIVNPKTKKIFSFQRPTKDEQYSEKRLQGKWSWGIGGHIDEVDVDNRNPIHDCMIREISEEIKISTFKKFNVLGYINDDTPGTVEEVHFGILYVAEVDLEEIPEFEDEIENGQFRSIEELEKILNSSNQQVEMWSKIAFEPLKKYLG